QAFTLVAGVAATERQVQLLEGAPGGLAVGRIAVRVGMAGALDEAPAVFPALRVGVERRCPAERPEGVANDVGGAIGVPLVGERRGGRLFGVLGEVVKAEHVVEAFASLADRLEFLAVLPLIEVGEAVAAE